MNPESRGGGGGLGAVRVSVEGSVEVEDSGRDGHKGGRAERDGSAELGRDGQLTGEGGEGAAGAGSPDWR
uniref:Uncharacterized protein n=1 Tax=Chromera velia CCMP2878 TaxID=1169474 RepID=A0A0G4G9P3_9ALVE|eukprot:Cvel_20833.t1-p1 / transcript=Cvel_20833.t1 / gene=Cvel_20833 / organism=Chromera_velia_CCMP2878 / gene_product=hypothetical protein / transcript_product=hypothetical protein / location=Cvel_scaffold1906:6195-6401(+) / protein_length=69 / sequence_SO=supercontig / SO=protein_coding / is_pseudo=false